jgi:hypothetical protein
MCAGEIPGALTAAARNVEELIKLSLEAVRVQWRFYHHLVERAIKVEDVEGNWGVTITGTTEKLIQEILDDFHDCEVKPKP